MRRLFGGLGFSPSVQPAAIDFAWSGNVSTTTATVKCRSVDTPTLLYATNSSLTNPTSLAGTEGSDEMWTFSLTGLSANTTYYYSFVGWDETAKLRTFPSGAANFTIAAASCAGQPGTGNGEYITGPAQTSDSPAFARIEDRDPALFIHLGDLHYRDISTNSPSSFRTAYRDVLSNARQASLYRNVPFAYIWDDHDYGANNSDGTSASKPAAQSVYREYVPHWTVPAASIYQTFTIGRVRFILLDVRSDRSPNGNTDNSSKTMLGATQKQWLKDTLDAATEPCIVVCSGSAWNSSLADGWGSFSTERQELAEFFEDNSHTDRLFILHGDIHALMGDDGTNTQHDPGSANNGPPLAGFAPLDGGATTYSGTYTHAASTDSNQQYGILEFVDNGSQITVTARAYEVSDGSEVEAWNFSKVYTG